MTSVGVYEASDAFNPIFVAAPLENGKCLESIPRIKEGLAVTESGRALKVQTQGPHLVSLGSGRLSTAITIHPLPQGRIYVGSQDSSQCKDFVLHGVGIERDHCFIENNNGVVTIYPQAGGVFIDGAQILEPTRLSQGCMLCLGRSCFFRFNNPKEAQRMKEVLPNNMLNFGSTTSLPEIKTNYHQIVRRPSAGSFDMESVDFVEKVSKFEYLCHSQLPPQTSQDTPKWFVKEGVRIPHTPSKQRGPKSQPPLDFSNLRNPSPLSRFMDSTTPVTKHGFSTPPPNQSSPNKVAISPKSTRFYSKTPDPISVNRKSPGNLSGSSTVKSGTLSGCSSHHVSAENIRACEKELKEQHRKAVQERLKDEEQERQERLRLEEILNLCAEYEERSQREKQFKGLEENPSVSSSSASSREFSGVSSGASNPESTNSSKGSNDSHSTRTESNPGYFPEEVRFNGSHELQPFPKNIESPSNVILSNSLKLNSSPPFTHIGSYYTIPNRIKTNGSLPRDRSTSHFSPTNEVQAFPQAPNMDYNSGTSATLYVNHKALNSASSEDELCAILGNTTVAKSSPPEDNNTVSASSLNCPHSPRTRIRTVAGLPEKGPEIYENRLALNEYSRTRQASSNLPNQDTFMIGPFEVEGVSLRSKVINGNMSSLDGELEGEIYQLQRERQHCIQAIGAIKQKVSELDVQKTEFLSEHGLEHALLAGELKDEEERQAMESGRISDLQTKKIALEQKCAVTQEEIEIAREKVSQQERKVQEMRQDLKMLQEQCSSHLTDDIEIKLEKLKSQMEFLDLEKKAFEDLEFQQLESQAHREEEREALSQEIERLTNNLTQRQKKCNELALQKLKLVTQLEKEKYNFECQLKTYTDHLQQEVEKLEDVSNKLKTLTSLNPGIISCFSDDSSPRTSDSDLEMQRNGTWCQTQVMELEGNISPNRQRLSGERSDNCNSFHSFESESSSVTSSDNGGENGRRHEDQVKPVDSGSVDLNKVKQREQALQSALQDQRPLVNHQHENGNFEVKRREKHKAQRPLTRYLPVRNVEFDLRQHIESAGHQIELCPHIHLTASSCHGCIHKLGGKWRTWKKRWFVFDRVQKVLLYYSDKSESKLKGGIYFQSIAEVYVDHLHSVKSPSPHSTFCVKTYDKVYYLMAPTPEAMRIWVDVIFTGAEGYLDFIAEGE